VTSSSFDTLAVHPGSPSILYGGSVSSTGIFRSLDGGATWTSLAIGPEINGVRSIAIDPETSSTLYAGTGGKGVYRSTDFGLTWAAPVTSFVDRVTSMAIDRQNTSKLYAATRFSGVYRSVNAGADWALSNAGLTSHDVRAVTVDPQTSSHVYAGTASGVFKSVNGGTTWTAMNAGLAFTSLDVRTLAVDPQTGVVYAGIFGYGIYRSLDGGVSWAAFNDGLHGISRNVHTIVLDPVLPGIMYAATSGSSVLRRVNAPLVASVDPNALVRGTTASATVVGSHFIPGHTTIQPIAGVTVNDVQVEGPTRLTVSLSIDATAAVGPRSFVVQTPLGTSASVAVQVSDPFADLSISSPTVSIFGQGASETYSITLQNIGTAPTTGISTVTTTLPAGLTFVSASPGWACSTGSAAVACSWSATMAAGESVGLTMTLAAGTGGGGAHTVSVSTAGDLNTSNNTVAHAGTVVSVPLPRIVLSSTSLQPGQQVTATVSLATPSPHDLIGTLSLGFVSDAVIQGDDPAIQFATGGRQVAYVIPANTLTAHIGGSAAPGPIGFQTGTVAGTLSLTGTVNSGTVQLTFAPVATPGALSIARHAPSIHSVHTRTDGGFAAYVLASSTMREVTSVSLQFNTRTGVQLSCGAVAGCSVSGSTITLDTRGLFSGWFAANTSLGSLSVLRMPLSIDPGLRGTVTVRLHNSAGASGAGTFELP
jgi:uncharacterized repeat protein (TIGR01451 family)